jgi:hypothetical protein
VIPASIEEIEDGGFKDGVELNLARFLKIRF